jgi:hypothetical protein
MHKDPASATPQRYYDPYHLRQVDNTSDAWRANARGVVTDFQAARLKRIPRSQQTKGTWLTRHIERPTDKQLMHVFVTSFIALSLIIAFWNSATLRFGSVCLAFSLVLVYLALFLSAYITNMIRAQSPIVRSIQGLLSTEPYCGVSVDGREFADRLTFDYWQLLSEDELVNGQRPFIIHYLDNWCSPPPILSMHPLDAVLPPGEAKLKRVVGVGDDGELVYADELEGEQETTEIIEIERKDRGGIRDG